MKRVAAVVAALGLLALAPSPAWAEGSIVAPGNGLVVEQHERVSLEARVAARSEDTELQLRDPLGVPRTVASAPTASGVQSIGFLFDTGCPSYPGTRCTGRQPVRNGTWTVALTGGSTDSRTFVVKVAPRAPENLEGAPGGPGQVVLSWTRGDEPDLTGYVVVDDQGKEVDQVGLGACEAPTCRHVVSYTTAGPSTEMLAVQARRTVCPECTDRLTSPSSAVVSVQRPAGPVPGPTPAPNEQEGTPAPGASGAPAAGPSASGSPSPSPAPTGGSGRADAGTLSFGGLTPGGLPLQLPGSTGLTVAAPQVAPLDDGAFDPVLPFGEAPTVLEPVLPSLAAPPLLRAGDPSVWRDPSVVRSGAAALLLLLGAAHLRRWLTAGT